MKEVFTGQKKGTQEPTAIRDPKTGELVVFGEEIKKVTIAYCADNLTKKLRMEEMDEDGFEVDKNDFKEVMRNFGTKKRATIFI